MANHFKYIVIGGGLAGASAIEGIRAHDSSGAIALFGKESHLPYDRPPLSKGLWLGKTTLDQLPVHEQKFYQRHHVHLHLGVEIVAIDRQRKQVLDKEGKGYGYDKVVIATGGSPRTLSFGGDAVRYFRTLDDYSALREAVNRHEEFVLIGGGFIGAELAAVLSMLGKEVTLISRDEYILQKVLPRDLAAFVTEYYRKHKVKLLSGDVPTAVERSSGRTRVHTREGERLEVDVVLAAIGLNLHTEMALHAGLKVENGIAVNELLQTSDPHIYAAGDIAYFPARALGKKMRVEHWNNAQMQGRYAGANMAGAHRPYDYLPYFYSDLFDLGFEAVGDLDSQHQIFADWKEEFREGVVYYLDEQRVVGVLLWNVWEKVDAARELITQKKAYTNVQALKGRL